jgi:coenzyme F420-reducing hydrogenase beta subunit
MQCIEMKQNLSGFLMPTLDITTCVLCLACKHVCPSIHSSIVGDQKRPTYAAINKDKEVLNHSSSGGSFTSLSAYIIDKGGVVCGCIFDDDFMPKHIFTDSLDGLKKMRGSKYVQSDLGNTLKETKQYLSEGRWVLYTGTPCQIAGLKAFLGKEHVKLITVDLICHGVPSPMLFKEHIRYLAKKYKADILEYSFRNKMKSWGVNYYFYYKRYRDKKIRLKADYYNSDSYYVAFMKNLGLRECCYNCQYTSTERQGDFTIADWWGIDKVRPEIPSDKGVSLIFVNTDKATSIFKQIDTLQTWETKPEEAIPYQRMLQAPALRPIERNSFYKFINENGYAAWADPFYSPKAYLLRRAKLAVRRVINVLPLAMQNTVKEVLTKDINT